MDQARPFKVSEFTFLIQRKLESEPAFRGATVVGEISNLRPPGAAGHVYFTLKDSQAQISCAMFKTVAMRYYRDLPANGEEVVITGDLNVYPPQGSYQLIVRSMERGGVEGMLHRKFLALKAKLEGEGLFDPGRKRKIPAIPRKIGIVTSPTGAVIRDIINTVRRRFPHVELVLVPAVVQGEQAAASIVAGLQSINKLGDVDVVILARGGGSLEDLWCFNEEIVARAIVASKIPVVSGVGHETDFTIADFVADLRAATPTAAAEMVVPSAATLIKELNDQAEQLKRSLLFFVQNKRQQLDDFEYKLEVRLNSQLDVKRGLLKDLQTQLEHAFWNSLQRSRHEISMLEAKLNALDIRQVLDRGFTVTEINGKRVKDAAQLAPGDLIETHFYKGKASSRIENIDTHG